MKKQIGTRLRAARERATVTQEEAGQAAGVSRAAVSMWERGKSLPSMLQFRELVALYGVSGYQILFGENPFELTAAEARELTRASKDFSPALRIRTDLMIALMTRAAAVRDDIPQD